MIPGDVFVELSAPAICKSRLVREGNSNNVLFNLNKVRHFLWIDDPFSWEEKQCRILLVILVIIRKILIFINKDNYFISSNSAHKSPVYHF